MDCTDDTHRHQTNENEIFSTKIITQVLTFFWAKFTTYVRKLRLITSIQLRLGKVISN